MKKKLVAVLSVAMLVVGYSVSISAYNPAKVAEYAKKHATNYNDEYPAYDMDCTNFVSQCVHEGGLAMKKKPIDNISYSDMGEDEVYKETEKKYWECSKRTKKSTLGKLVLYSKKDWVISSTWTLVSKSDSGNISKIMSKVTGYGFYNYMKANGATVYKDWRVNTDEKIDKLTRKCAIGDVLQVRTDEENMKYHSVVVVDKSYDKKNERYDIKIAYHTNDTPPTDFRKKLKTDFGTDGYWTILKVSESDLIY